MSRRKFTWTKHQLYKLNKIKNILEELKDYKPLTLRQIYYQLVGKGYIDNNKSQYTMLSTTIKQARLDGFISWADIEDRVRAYHDLTGWPNKDSFIEGSLKQFLTGYQRDLLQSQNKYLELWIEKDALSSIFTRVASPYSIPVVVCRGYSSVSFLNDLKKRLKYKEGKETTLLYFGDFDPSGMNMLEAMKVTLLEELKVDVGFKRVALLKEDIAEYNLPHSPDALKKSDPRAKAHVKEFGELAVELDALPPAVLEEKIRTAIEEELNMGLFNKEVENNNLELDKLNILKTQVITMINGVI